jgi:CubicO group peptidase (beta-lactamase class C family)
MRSRRHSHLISLGAFVFGMALAASSLSAAEPVGRERITAALPQLEALAEKMIAESHVPGLAIGIVHNDEVVYLKGFGRRSADKPASVDADTVFQIASMSKPVSATVVAALVGKKVLSWDSKIADLDPAFRLHDPYPTAELTVRDLFAHRSGLPGTAGDDLENIGYDRAEILMRLRFVPPSSSFRAGYSYSNFGLTEGAVAATTPIGKPWEDVAEDLLYRPLGMSSTSSRHADFMKRENRAALHVPVDGKWIARIERQPDAQAPAGGVSSTVRDLAQWLRLELRNGIFNRAPLIAPAALAATHEPLMTRGKNPVTGGESFYGLGWNVEFGRYGLSWGHAGAFSVGARTLVTIYPDADFGIVILCNAFPTGVPEGLSDSFADLVFTGRADKDWVKDWNAVYAGIFGPAMEAAKATYATPPSPVTPAEPASVYVGTYANDFVGEAMVSANGSDLVLKVGPNGARSFSLKHFDRDIFLTYPDAEMPDTPSAVKFDVGPDGKAATVTIGFLDGNKLGSLNRVGD